jgi:hypothetical protein
VTTACILIPVGPGPPYIRGFVDLLESLAVYEPNRTRVIAVCEGHADDIHRAADTVQIPVEVITNPRGGRGSGLLGGGCCGTIAGLSEAARGGDALVIKIDTDALIVGACFDRVRKLFEDRPQVGVAGHIFRGPKVMPISRAVRRLALPVAVWRKPRPGHARVLPMLSAPRRRVAAVLRRARAAGWEPGTHIQGGAYAISPRLLAALDGAGVLDRPLDWLDVPLGEDVMMSALAVAHGFELMDASGVGQPFGISWGQLPWPAPEMLARGHALIHSLKGDPEGRSEPDLREYFAQARRSGLPGSPRG